MPGHPSINGEANELFGEYQDQATDGKIQFRRWPLRSVSLSNYSLSILFSLVFLVNSTNVGVL
jgi:hypothetical protein